MQMTLGPVLEVISLSFRVWRELEFPEAIPVEISDIACIQWSLRFKTPLFNNSLHFKTGHQ